MRIVILDAYCVNPGDLSWDALASLGELHVHDRTPEPMVLERIAGAEVVLTNKVRITREVMEAAPSMRYVGVLATGYDVVDVEAASERGVVVCNIPAYSSNSVVQMTFAHILNIVNRVGHYARQNRDGMWSSCPDFSYRDAPLFELSGKTIGIVGLGSIGMRVALLSRYMGLGVYACTGKEASSLPEGIRKATLDGLLGVSDILTLHCPLTDATRGMINRGTISRMKRGAILINTGRGPLVNERDVAEALGNGHLAGYGADVMCQEPPSRDNPLLSAPNAYLTPHIAWATLEARRRLVDVATSNVRAYIGGNPQNQVNR